MFLVFNHMADGDDTLDDLLDRLEQQGAGLAPDIEALCRERPDLGPSSGAGSSSSRRSTVSTTHRASLLRRGKGRGRRPVAGDRRVRGARRARGRRHGHRVPRNRANRAESWRSR